MKKKSRERWSIETIDITSKSTEPEAEKMSRRKRLRRFLVHNRKKLLIGAAACYVLFFTIGLCTTRIYTDENGTRQAYKMSLSDLKKQDDYKALKDKLTGMRSLLVEITIVDIHLANGEYETYEAATLYTKILNEKLDVMLPRIGAMNLQQEQEPVRKAIENFLSYDMALYLQNIAAGLSSGSAETVRSALAYRDKALATYGIVEAEIEKLSISLHIEERTYFNWELQQAVVEKDGTAILKGSEGKDD